LAVEKKGKGRSAKAVELPFATFADIEALGLEARIWCSGCHSVRRASFGADHRHRQFAGARLICKRRVPAQFGGGSVTCNSLGHLMIRPVETVDPSTAAETVTLVCPRCVPPWEIGPIRRSDFARLAPGVFDTAGAYFVCPACDSRLETHWSGGSGVPFTSNYR
jgi:hypothetical protein